MFGVFSAWQVIGISAEQFFGFFIELSFVFLLKNVLIAGFVGVDGRLVHALPHYFLLDILDWDGCACFFVSARLERVIFAEILLFR